MGRRSRRRLLRDKELRCRAAVAWEEDLYNDGMVQALMALTDCENISHLLIYFTRIGKMYRLKNPRGP
jgi:hypothetical protein